MKHELRHVAAIVAAFFLVVLLIGLGGDYPVNDDWAYAWSATHLAATGELRILDWAAPSLVTHVAWGAALVRLFGPSYVVLRAGTLAWSLAAVLLLYGVARRSSLTPRMATLAALGLLVCPWFVNLSFSYMSDVPFLAMILLAMWLALGRPGVRSALLAGTAIAVAALMRQLALVIAPAFALLIAVDCHAEAGPWLRRALLRCVALGAPVVLAYGAFTLWMARVHHATVAYRQTIENLHLVRWWHPLVHGVMIWHYVGLMLLPIGVALVVAGRARALLSWRAATLLLGALVAFALVAVLSPGDAAPGVALFATDPRPSSPLRPLMPYLGNIVNLVSLGVPTLFETFEGREPLPHACAELGWALTLLSTLGALVVAGLGVRALRRARAGLRSPTGGGRARVLLLATAGLYAAWLLATSLFVFDRYLLPLLAISLVLGLDAVSDEAAATGAPRSSGQIQVARWWMAALVPVAIFSIGGEHEYLAWNGARLSAVRALAARGVADDDVDAGFEINGPRRFQGWLAQHPGSLGPERGGWWAGPEQHYRLSFWSTRAGCTEDSRWPYWSWGSDRAIHVLRCR